MSRKIRVLVVDDSAVVRQVVTQTLSSDPGIEVIGAALDPVFALEKMKTNWPDVIVLDLEMPRMDGLTFLRRIMAERPTPVVICSSLAEKGAQVALDALAAGAVSIITKPKVGLKSFLDGAANDIIQAVKAAAHSRPGRRASAAVASLSPSPSLSADVILPAAHNASAPLGRTTDRLVAIGTSTGGTQALEAVLTALPVDTPGVVVVQHMPEKFTAMFAQRLNSLCKIEVREARSGDRVLPGLALIAPGGRHMMVKRNGAQYVVDVVDGPLVNRHKPSVDVLFRSVAKCAGHNALGIIMTGMGDDGARGLKEMRDAGAHTLAEDESTCVVFGMPKEAIRLGGAAEVLPLTRMAEGIGRFTRS
ncbi:chemotaxis response regulator protein-glutamate methylesterase [Rivihabitans pingtungensis]|jgi:two-component system chemotaxis response regulator CheB|uniref:protein-glutamate methylesterase/protein-glutamine glutaminase n=1 Tax=Rivihabitans pingtungensis TaxID=1054498 RepID=UPI002BC4233D|nr:chemotaxis response regulator protein-glutamate methylesterase [Rivihabitans pingtungensis]HNX71131.1 chemotaxis response regulator protein-glutamate methylesterase [Rivihabitans pingtungensis]